MFKNLGLYIPKKKGKHFILIFISFLFLTQCYPKNTNSDALVFGILGLTNTCDVNGQINYIGVSYSSVQVSDNGTCWKNQKFFYDELEGGYSLLGIARSVSKYVIIGRINFGGEFAFHSSDGVNWQRSELFNFYNDDYFIGTASIVFSGSKFIFTSSENSFGTINISSDQGSSFNRVLNTYDSPNTMLVSNGRIIGLGRNSITYSDDEGANWNDATIPSSWLGEYIATNGSNLILTFGSSNGSCFLSTDNGENFSPCASPGFTRVSLIHADGNFITHTVEGDSMKLGKSPDGVNWTYFPMNGFPSIVASDMKFCNFNDKFFFMGTGSGYISDDALNYKPVRESTPMFQSAYTSLSNNIVTAIRP